MDTTAPHHLPHPKTPLALLGLHPPTADHTSSAAWSIPGAGSGLQTPGFGPSASLEGTELGNTSAGPAAQCRLPIAARGCLCIPFVGDLATGF